jgi:hypothetical protein
MTTHRPRTGPEHWDSPPAALDGAWQAHVNGAVPVAARPTAATPPVPRARPAIVAHAAVLAAALACWVIALVTADLSRLSGYGLLAALPAPYYLALVLLAVGFALAAAAPSVRPALLGAYVVGLIAVLHATTPLLYPEPRYAWTYKHLGVIDYIAAHGSVDRAVDVYQNWPGFFALNAWFSQVAGIAPIDYAAWAQPAFELANAAVILFALRGVTRDARLRWIAVWLFVVANWIGQDYLAPQALGFLLTQVVLGLAIRCSAPRRGPPGEPSLASGPALFIAALCALATVVSHQLSPVVLIVSLAALRVVTGRPPAWIVAALAAVEAWWLWLSYDFISAHFRLFDVSVATTARPAAPALPGATLGADAPRAAILLMLALAGAGAVRRWRRGHRDLTALTLALAPGLVMGMQSYGGEAPIRAYLFALPWLAFFAAAACLPEPASRPQPALRRSWRLQAVTALVGTATLFGYFGQELLNYMAPADVALSRWYFAHAPPRASLTLIAPSFPDRVDRHYAVHLDSPPSLVEAPAFRPGRRAAADVATLTRLVRANHAPARYVALTPSGERYARYYGLLSPGSFAALARTLRGSPDFRLVHRERDAALFEYVGRR